MLINFIRSIKRMLNGSDRYQCPQQSIQKTKTVGLTLQALLLFPASEPTEMAKQVTLCMS
jgi:hypothetical protein